MKSPTSLDTRAYFKKFRITYKINLKEMNFTDAKQKIDETKRELKMTKNYIKSCDSTIGSIIFGFFTSAIPYWKRNLLLALIPIRNYCSYCQ